MKMKYLVLAVALLAASVAQANSITDLGCFTPVAGFSYITSQPICPPIVQVVTPPSEPITMPEPVVNPPQFTGDGEDEDNDSQGDEGVVRAADSVAPVGVPEPSSAWLLMLGLTALMLASREYNHARANQT